MEIENNFKTTLVLGASAKPERYSNMAVILLKQHNHQVYAIGNKEVEIYGVTVTKNTPIYENIHTITLYLSPKNQESYYDYILQLNPKRIIFNPGTENENLMAMANAHGIKTLEACTLVMLKTNQF
jgi:uncharacterized protein